MTVKEYKEKLLDITDGMLDICYRMDIKKLNKYKNPCIGCALHKGDSKPCPLGQLADINDALSYAVDNNFDGITADTSMDTPQVISFLRRAVVNGYSIKTLRYCDAEYQKKFNLIPIEFDVPVCK